MGRERNASIRQLRILTHGTPYVSEENWRDLYALGWHWVSTWEIDANDSSRYAVAAQKIRELQKELGRENVAIGDAFDTEVHAPCAEENTIAIYTKDVKALVFSLYRDLANWDRLDPDEVDDLCG